MLILKQGGQSLHLNSKPGTLRDCKMDKIALDLSKSSIKSLLLSVARFQSNRFSL